MCFFFCWCWQKWSSSNRSRFSFSASKFKGTFSSINQLQSTRINHLVWLEHNFVVWASFLSSSLSLCLVFFLWNRLLRLTFFVLIVRHSVRVVYHQTMVEFVRTTADNFCSKTGLRKSSFDFFSDKPEIIFFGKKIGVLTDRCHSKNWRPRK